MPTWHFNLEPSKKHICRWNKARYWRNLARIILILCLFLTYHATNSSGCWTNWSILAVLSVSRHRENSYLWQVLVGELIECFVLDCKCVFVCKQLSWYFSIHVGFKNKLQVGAILISKIPSEKRTTLVSALALFPALDLYIFFEKYASHKTRYQAASTWRVIFANHSL